MSVTGHLVVIIIIVHGVEMHRDSVNIRDRLLPSGGRGAAQRWSEPQQCDGRCQGPGPVAKCCLYRDSMAG